APVIILCPSPVRSSLGSLGAQRLAAPTARGSLPLHLRLVDRVEGPPRYAFRRPEAQPERSPAGPTGARTDGRHSALAHHSRSAEELHGSVAERDRPESRPGVRLGRAGAGGGGRRSVNRRRGIRTAGAPATRVRLARPQSARRSTARARSPTPRCRA